MSTNWVQDMADMHKKYGVNEWFEKHKDDKVLMNKYLMFRLLMCQEELHETMQAVNSGNSEEIVDGLIDLCVFAIGTLDVFNVDASKAWDEIYAYKPTDLGRQGEGRNLTGGKLKWCRWLAAEGSDEDQADGQTARKAVEFLRSEHTKPFFLAVGLAKPHDPFIAPKKYFDLYLLEECMPPRIPDGWEPPYPHTLPGQKGIFDQFTDRERIREKQSRTRNRPMAIPTAC